jgi:hypothetical protein
VLDRILDVDVLYLLFRQQSPEFCKYECAGDEFDDLQPVKLDMAAEDGRLA